MNGVQVISSSIWSDLQRIDCRLELANKQRNLFQRYCDGEDIREELTENDDGIIISAGCVDRMIWSIVRYIPSLDEQTPNDQLTHYQAMKVHIYLWLIWSRKIVSYRRSTISKTNDEYIEITSIGLRRLCCTFEGRRTDRRRRLFVPHFFNAEKNERADLIASRSDSLMFNLFVFVRSNVEERRRTKKQIFSLVTSWIGQNRMKRMAAIKPSPQMIVTLRHKSNGHEIRINIAENNHLKVEFLKSHARQIFRLENKFHLHYQGRRIRSGKTLKHYGITSEVKYIEILIVWINFDGWTQKWIDLDRLIRLVFF
jgi:hypothetical protein